MKYLILQRNHNNNLSRNGDERDNDTNATAFNNNNNSISYARDIFFFMLACIKNDVSKTLSIEK